MTRSGGVVDIFPRLLALAFGAANAGAADLASDPARLGRYEPGEFSVRSSATYANPFRDVEVWAVLSGPAGETLRVPGFCAEPGPWAVRAAFPTVGKWQVAIESTPADPALKTHREVEVEPSSAAGFLRIDPARQRFVRDTRRRRSIARSHLLPRDDGGGMI